MTTRASVEAAWRTEAPRLIGGLVRIVRDLDLAEDLAQEALLAALEKWPETGIPDNPGAWLMATAKNRAIDRARGVSRGIGRSDRAARGARARARESRAPWPADNGGQTDQSGVTRVPWPKGR